MAPLIIKIFGNGLWHFVSKNSAKFMPYTENQNINLKLPRIMVYFQWNYSQIENIVKTTWDRKPLKMGIDIFH